MNFKPIFTAAALLYLSFTGYSQSKIKMTPLEYNDYLSYITDSLYSKGSRWGTKFTQIRDGNKDYSRLKPLRKDITEYIILKKEEVRKTAPVGKNGDAMKQAMLTFMEFELDMIETGFMPLENLDQSSSDKDVDAIINNLVEKANKEDSYLDKVHTAQKEFADTNGFKIETEED